MYNIKFSSTSL